MDVDGAKNMHPGDDVLAYDHFDSACRDECLVEPAQLVTEATWPPSLVRGWGANRILEDRVVCVQCKPAFLVVLPGELRRCLGGAEDGFAVIGR